MRKFLTWLKDTVERTVFTYGEALCGLLLVGPAINVSTAEAAAVAALPAALTVLKSAFAAARSGTLSPASLVKPPTP
jgi:hypothetical protein